MGPSSLYETEKEFPEMGVQHCGGKDRETYHGKNVINVITGCELEIQEEDNRFKNNVMKFTMNQLGEHTQKL